MTIESFQISDTLQTFLVGLLRYAFTNNTTYTYSTDPTTTKIAVYRDFPKVLPSFPIVLVQTPTNLDLPRYLGSDILQEVHGQVTYDDVTFADGLCYQVFGGNFSTGITISVKANTSKEREVILDWIVTYLRSIYKDYLESRSIDVLNIRREGVTTEIYNSELLYLSTVSMDLFGEWSKVTYPEGSGILSKIYISGASYLTTSGVTYSDLYTSLGDID